MKKGLFAAVAVLLMSGLAQAQITAPVWQCSLDFAAHGGGIQAVVGDYALTGNGTIRCLSVTGEQAQIPVRVVMTDSYGLAAAYDMNVRGLATGIGVATTPEALEGVYYSVDAKAAAIVGVGGTVAVHGGQEAATFNIAVQAISGLGANIGFSKLEILPVN